MGTASEKTIAQFKADLGKFAEEVKGRVSDEKQQLARLAARSLIRYSPIDTAAYLRSMRVGVNTVRLDYYPYEDKTEEQLPHLDEAQKEFFRDAELTRLLHEVARARVWDSVNLSNHIPYSKYVEYIGWKNTAAYHVFTRTKLRLSQIAHGRNASTAGEGT